MNERHHDSDKYLVARHIDRDYVLKTEIPFKIRNDKRGDKPATGSIDVDRGVQTLLAEQIVDGLDVLILASVSGAEDGADSNGVFIHQVDRLLRIDHVAVGSAVYELLIYFEIPSGQGIASLAFSFLAHENLGDMPCRLFPTHLNGR